MAEVKVNKITNCNLYIDGGSLLGKVKELELPKIVQIMADHEALGLIGKFKLPSGVEPMEMKIGFNSYYDDVMGTISDPTKAVKLQVRGSVETWESGGRTAQRPAVCFIVGTFTTADFGNFSQHENVVMESMVNVTSVRLEIAGVEKVSFDAFANLYRVNGIDIAGTYRENIGQ